MKDSTINTHFEQIQKKESTSVASSDSQQFNEPALLFQFIDNRPKALSERKVQKIASNSITANQTTQMQAVITRPHSRPENVERQNDTIQKKHSSSLQTQSVIQRSSIGKIENLLLHSPSVQRERKGSFRVSERLKGVEKNLKNEKLKPDIIERNKAYKHILTSGKSYNAMIQAHELAKTTPLEDLKTLISSDESVLHDRSLERGKERVEFAKKHSKKILGQDRKHTDKEKPKALIDKMKASDVTFNFDFAKTNTWKKPQMLNSFEVLKDYGVMSGNLKGYIETRDEVENEQFGIPKGVNKLIKKNKDDQKKGEELNRQIPPALRPKYAALNFAGYSQGSAPSKFYGLSHMIFKNSIKERCTITGGDSLGDAGGLAGLAFPLTDEGVEGLVEYCSRFSNEQGVEWKSLDTGGQDDIDTSNENVNNPDWNFIEVQIHGDVLHKNDVDKITIAKSELGDTTEEDAIAHIKKITQVNNVIVE